MSLDRKRPFGVNVEDRKQKLIKLVYKFSRENMSMGEKKEREEYSHWNKTSYKSWGKNVKLSCPICPCNINYFLGDYAFIDRDFNKDLTDDQYYDWAYQMLSHHVKRKVRMDGCNDHMQLILDIFGEKEGLEILEMFAKKNLIVAQRICEFIQSRVLVSEERRKDG